MRLSEEILRIKEIMGSVISEASKIDILVNKLGLTQDNAEKIERICGKLSIIMVNKIRNHISDIIENNGEKDITNERISELLNDSLNRGHFFSTLTSIMDYIRVGLNGDMSTLKDFNFNGMYTKSVEWHNSLEVGQGKINYVEEYPIILDFREGGGDGFYWVNLQTNYSEEECERMGHCGRTGYGNTLYSLREYKTLPGGKYTLNESHLTASIGDDGTLYQLKGPKNSKPKEEYHNLILPLFYVLGGEGEEYDYLIRGFGSEYASQLDFKISDLGENTIKSLYSDRPELFESPRLMRKLINMGIIEKPNINYVVKFDIEPSDVDDFIDGNYVVSQRGVTNTKSDGTTYRTTIKYYMFESILEGDLWEFINDDWGDDWKSGLEYYVDSKNENEIEEIIRIIAFEKNPKIIEEDFNELSLEEKIEEYDDDWEIRGRISNSLSDARTSAYINYCYNLLKDCLEELGEVLKMDDSGVTLVVDTEKYFDINTLSDERYDDLIHDCGGEDIPCMFKEMLGEEIEKPTFSISDYYEPDVDDGGFNEILSDRLSEI